MKKTYLLLLFTIVLITIGLIISCNLEEREGRKEIVKRETIEIKKEIIKTEEETKTITYTEDKEIKFKRVLGNTSAKVGNAVFDIQSDANIKKKTELE